MFELKIFHDHKPVENITKMFPVGEGLLEMKSISAGHGLGFVLKYDRLIFEVIYNGIIMYWAARVAKRLESGIGCHIGYFFLGVWPPMQKCGSWLLGG